MEREKHLKNKLNENILKKFLFVNLKYKLKTISNDYLFTLLKTFIIHIFPLLYFFLVLEK